LANITDISPDHIAEEIQYRSLNRVGWDGIYKGKNLRSNDYRFNTVLINQNDEIKNRSGNFSLIRK
jgi:gliding motility-associated-like protein